MDKVFIIPSPSNPEGTDDGEWRIMLTEHGKDRWLNTATDHLDAVIKAERTATKRNLPVDLDHPKFIGVVRKDNEPVEEWNGDNWLRPCRRPRGAPAIGDRIKHPTLGEGEVTSYLDDQFVVNRPDGTERIIHVSETWELIL